MSSSDKHRAGWLLVALSSLPLILAACETQTPGPPANVPQQPGPNSNAGVAGSPAPPPPGSGDNTALEQLQLERMNRARLKPKSEAMRFGIDLNEGLSPNTITEASKQPLAFNSILTSTARAHSQDMLNQDYFAHNSLNGTTPFQRMTTAGYVFQTAGENLSWRGTTGTLDEISSANLQHQDLFVDDDYPGRGHRVAMMNPAYREVGIGVMRGIFWDSETNGTYDSLMSTQDFGARFSSPVFLIGVVYNDTNHNGDYDAGEGVANASVFHNNGGSTTTNAGGGYSFAVANGSYIVAFGTGAQSAVQVGVNNVKVDLADGTRIIINLGLGAF